MSDKAAYLSKEDRRRYIQALQTLPALTRVVLILASQDDHSYSEIAWRCGISETEVENRIVDAVATLDRYLAGKPPLIGTLRRGLVPLRWAWAATCARERDRSMAHWLRPERAPGRRGMLEWLARVFTLIAR